MSQVSTSRRSSLARGLDVAFVAALVAAVLVSLAPEQREVGLPYRIAGLSLLVAAVMAWLSRRRSVGHPSSSRRTVAFVLLVVLLCLVPGAPGAFLLLVIGIFVLALDLGARPGSLAALAFCSVLAVQLTLVYDVGWLSTMYQSAGLFLLLLLSCGAGSVVRIAESARADSEAARKELARANVRLRHALLVEGELALAQERARSARELHDGVGHRLTLVSLSLELANRLATTDQGGARREIHNAATHAKEALEEMRRWVRALDPPTTSTPPDASPNHEDDRRADYQALAASFGGTGLNVTVDHQGAEFSLPSAVSHFATRFLQEGLTNIVRHANATTVHIVIHQSPHQLRLAIGDDGDGADRRVVGGYGIRSLRERAALLNGTLSTGRAHLGGFELAAVVPIPSHEGG